MMPITAPRLHRQRGAATLIVTLLLFFTMTLVAAFASRGLIFEQRSATNQWRATQAFEAAEAGLEWALAQLNNPQSLGADCRSSGAPGHRNFRERLLQFDAAAARHTPATWNTGTFNVALQPACVRQGSGWACHCPSAGYPNLPAPATPAAAFSIQLAAGPLPGTVRLLATGCTSLGGACLPGSSTSTDATSRLQVLLRLVPGVATPPAAPLTLKNGIALPASTALGLHNPDAASGGITVHSGGDVDLPGARWTTAPGAAAATSIVSNDAALSALPAERLFASLFGLDKASWRAQAGVIPFVCTGSCGPALNTALGAASGSGAGARLVWVEGDLQLDGPVSVGSSARPVVLVVAGTARFNGPVALHGLVYAAALRWDGAGSGALVRGALVSETGYSGDAAPDLFYDAGVLAALKADTGSFARVAGSWKDF